ncbi:hypothetical protein MN116_005425 [Schistosoma mekongi]|uniref:Cadherin domain-containing protein n=1 Tax=Schistosoma mekongi TaxID=38744 RepID=A0AAE1ZDK7_SCHME|nr:hypothetical protein MN116_005425 [Schistosoma mekongi]
MILTILSLYIIFILIVRSVPDIPLRVDITEESPTGSIVPGVAEYLQQLISREQIKGLTQTTTTTFQLMNDGTFSNLFNLDLNTGRLIISGRIDREVLCPPWDNTGGTRASISISGGNSNNILTTQRNSNLLNGNDFSNSSPNDCLHALNILIITRPNQQSQHLTSGTIDKHVDSSVKTIRILVHVVIHDINDNAPRWHDINVLHVNFVETPSLPNNNGWNNVQTILRPVNENDAIRNAKSIDRAYDPDIGSNGSIVYRLIGPGSDYFRLGDNFNRNTNNDNIDAYHIQANSESLIHRKTDLTMDLYNTNNNNLNMITSTHETALQIWPILPLDRETKDFAGQGGIYNLTLFASDLGIPPKSTSIPLIITLIDVNDHIPQFHNPINQYEVNNHLNTNNNNNNFESNYVIYRPLNGNLRETIPVGSFVLQLNASDQDDGLHSKLTYGFCPCDRNLAQNYFKIDSITGRITVSHSLDYDNGPRQFRFKVIAKDSAPEPYTLTGTAIVEIILSDENDETPQINVMLLQPNSVHDTIPLIQHSFLLNKIKPNPDGAKLLREFTTTINENPQPETVIAYVQVFDPDHHGQDHIHCRLGPTDNFTLQYDPSSSSSSSGSSLLSSSSTISNSLLYFTKRNSLYENSLQQRTLTNTIHNKQDYRLITGTRLTDLSSSYSRLDREITPTQTITLTCTDSVGNSAYVLINVNLADLNDNSPEFVNNGHFVFQIPENQELPGNKPIWLGRTIAVDNDQGVNALITYRLDNSDHTVNEYSNTDGDTIKHSVNNINDMFELNSQTGDLYVKVVFDRETTPNDGMYRLKVLCIDNGEPSLTGTAQVEIFILDENDWPPQFTREVYTFSVPENIRIHEIVGEVEAIDHDADSKGKITYQLISHSYQPVNELSDWISLSSVQHNSRRLHLRTFDNELNVNEKILSLEVENTELNNTLDIESMKHKQFNKTNKQSFELPNSNIQQEKQGKTTLSNATNELSRNGMKSLKHINYSHSEKSPTLLNYFTVDRLTGKIRLIRALDRESIAFFTIEIVAIDSAPISPITSLRQINSMMSVSNINNANVTLTSKSAYYTPVHKSLSSTATVVIAVTDINDNSPIFRRPNTSTAIQLSLHETLGRQLLTMEATDADEGENARITYQIKSEVPRPPGGSGTGHFAIDESSGMLFIASSQLILGIKVPDEQSELRTDMKLESKSPLQYGMTNMPIDGNIQAYPSQNELNSSTRVLSNNILLSYHQPTVMSPIIPDIQHQHHHSMLSQIDHTTMNNNTNTLSPSRLRLLSTTSMGISPCGVYNKRESSIPHVLSNSEVNHLLTQSSYRPPSPDYQSLDAIWCNQNKFPSNTMSAIHRLHNTNSNTTNNNNSSINNTNQNTHRLLKNHQKLLTAHYSLGNSDNSVKHQLNNTQQHMMLSNDLIDSSLITPSQVTSDNTFLPHAYYEIATPSETWHTRCLPIFMPNNNNNNQHRILNDQHNNETHINLHTHHSNSRSYNHIATLGRPAKGKGRRHLPTSTINNINDDSMHNLQAGELAIHSVKRLIQHEQCRIQSNDKILMKSPNRMNLNKINCDNINKVADSNTYHDGDNIDVTSTTTATTKNDNKSSNNEHDVEKLQNDQLLEQKTTVQHYTYQAYREGTFV